MRILVAYDGSSGADAAIDGLTRAGLPDNAEIVVLCAADQIGPHTFPAHPAGEAAAASGHGPDLSAARQRWQARADQALQDARATAERGAQRLRGVLPAARVTVEAVADSPAWAVIRRAEDAAGTNWRADLVVMGAAGHGAVGRLVLGSAASQVLTHCRRSVRVGRATAADSAADRPIQLLLGADGSADSAAAAAAIAARRWPAGTRCHVLAAADLKLRTAHGLAQPGADPVAHALSLARAVAATLEKSGLDVHPEARPGEAAAVLLEAAAQIPADCIFVGARGLSRVDRFLLGSVSTALAMRAGCSVEVVHG